ncbi:hypothetical protein BDV96DRAFT_496773 [Lophiotrema nucula]|uniref:Adenosine deaminase domain-containing protein n=1 Tax=Lophiotrema nucula TaxID=690887 RepID=A0A6A5Z228_9PLEO|nr:hypothetical protein BDV96DRAFT_496773 [Lophiotrema nucula]
MTAQTQPTPTGLELFDNAVKDLGETTNAITYNNNRAELLVNERKEPWDREARAAANLDEKIACEMIRQIREFERVSPLVFGNVPSEQIPPPEARDMGGQFLTNKTRIENRSILFDISKMVPKGALLHLHFNAELHPERLLEECRELKTMYIRSLRPLLNEDDLKETEILFEVRDPVQESQHPGDIFDPGYKGAEFKKEHNENDMWMQWGTFRKRFNHQFGELYLPNVKARDYEKNPNSSEQGPVGLEPVENWVLQKMVLSEAEAYGVTQTVNGVWARFNQATRAFKGLLNYEQVYCWYIKKAIDRMIEEKVMYAELRPMLMDKTIPSTDGKRKLDLSTQMRLIIQGVKEVKAELEKEKRLDDFPFGLKVIYCTPRSISKSRMAEEMKDCLKLALELKNAGQGNFICGFDLVGAEDRPNNIGFYSDLLVAFQKACKDLGLNIPFMFHAGETLLDTGGSDDPSKSNLYDAALLSAKRIGHGVALLKHPYLIENYYQDIAVELCPISNELLHLVRNVKQHPYIQMLAAGIPCTINSDNPSLFSNSMSHEFYQVMVGSPTMDVHGWKQFALWSLKYSCLSDDHKKHGNSIFLERWNMFCAEVIDTYSVLFDSAKIEQLRQSGTFDSKKIQLARDKVNEAFEKKKARDDERVKTDSKYAEEQKKQKGKWKFGDAGGFSKS